MMRLIIFYLVGTVLASCKSDEDFQQVFMVNDSDEKVVFVSSADYPDTVSFTISGCSTRDIGNIVYPKSSKIYAVGSKSEANWSSFLDSYPSNTLMVFVYNADSAASISGKIVGCDSLYNRPDLILKRFDIDLAFLINNDFKLIYP